MNSGLVETCTEYVLVPAEGDVTAFHDNVREEVLLMLVIPFEGDDNTGQAGTLLVAVMVKPVVGVAPFAE